MLNETFKMDGVDYSGYIKNTGLERAYVPMKGLPDKTTLDTVKHIDLHGTKLNLAVPFNPMEKAVVDALVAAYTTGLHFITIYDHRTGADVTLTMEPGTATVKLTLVDGTDNIYKISDLPFTEL